MKLSDKQTARTPSIAITVAAHKLYEFPTDPIYMPSHVGKAVAEAEIGIPGDDSGDSISSRNAAYAELTGLYWAWRNRDSQIVGLVHYRRYFAGSGWRGVATRADILAWMQDSDMVVARPRRYWIETVRSHYSRAHHEQDLEHTREVLARQHPEYLPAFDRVLSRRQLSLYNMYIAHSHISDDYCRWLFPILDACYQVIPFDQYGPQQQRAIGFLGERLLNVWVEHNADRLRIDRRSVVQLEPENKLAKAVGLIKRRFARWRVD